MRRRHLFNLSCGTSLVLCLATVVLWACSYPLRPEVSHDGWDRRAVALRAGAVQFLSVSRFTMRTVGWSSTHVPIVTTGQPFRYAAAPAWHLVWRSDFTLPPASHGVAVRPLATMTGGGLPQPGLIHGSGFEMSLWPFALASSILPAVWSVQRGRFRAAGRTARGLCPACGYDLRATPGRCPECGTTSITR